LFQARTFNSSPQRHGIGGKVGVAEAIQFHNEGLKLRSKPMPESTSSVDYVHVAA
jgi:hypothetical protein